MLLRRFARPLLASWFVTEGLDAARRPSAHVAFARPAVDALLEKTSGIDKTSKLDRISGLPRPSDAQLRIIIQVHGAATALAGLALALGKAPRTAALALAALTLPLAAASMPGRKGETLSPEVRRERRDRFVRSLAFTGAALLTGVDTEGRPGVSWRLAKARQVASARTSAAASGAVEHAKSAVNAH